MAHGHFISAHDVPRLTDFLWLIYLHHRRSGAARQLGSTRPYIEYKCGVEFYDWVIDRPEYLRIADDQGIKTLDFDNGLMRALRSSSDFFELLL